MKEIQIDKVPLGQRLAYALGNAAANFLSNGIGGLALPIYSIGGSVRTGPNISLSHNYKNSIQLVDIFAVELRMGGFEMN